MAPPRAPLTRELVLGAAIDHVDKHGLNALTMRALGQDLGVEAMSIYHHVNGREDLLEGIVEQLVQGIRVPPRTQLGPADGWQTFLQHVAHAVRSLALAHPNLFPLVATRPPAAPWLRPPLRSLRLVEDFLDGLLVRGMSEQRAVDTYQAFTSFLLGHLLLEVSALGAETGPPEEPLDEGGADVPNAEGRLDTGDYPTVVRLEARLRHHNPDVEFESSLEALLDRMDGDVSQ